MQTWYNIQSRIFNSLCNLSASNISCVWFILSIISFILDSIKSQIRISDFSYFLEPDLLIQFFSQDLFCKYFRLFLNYAISFLTNMVTDGIIMFDCMMVRLQSIVPPVDRARWGWLKIRLMYTLHYLVLLCNERTHFSAILAINAS